MSEKPQYNDYPLLQVAQDAKEKVDNYGATVWQKWTCKHCGSRQTMEKQNTFFAAGICEECGQTSEITECNYLLHMGLGVKK